ncbi:hypothetical protein HGI30_06115 [Paenibacillus albicereus]|uniref:Uncharacterized protein n=1 Tax=Paenibacillus albicereus TaxID=2726185 RepID=A0A6H2GUS9_9BACL|nr:hypothetical protein [Paenibacillus albicereus]QJC51181.1 hypothetical protein HGI30_06115 [Paenibacillus albicereus]
MAKMMSVKPVQQTKNAVDRLFQFMNLMAWTCLLIGVVTSLWNITHFSDTNMTLMVGIGFLIGSVFIYTSGAALHLLSHKLEQLEDRAEDRS